MAKQYPSPPAMQIDPNKSYTATFHTEKGDFVVDLFTKQAPITTNNFIFWPVHGKDFCHHQYVSVEVVE